MQYMYIFDKSKYVIYKLFMEHKIIFYILFNIFIDYIYVYEILKYHIIYNIICKYIL